MPSAAVEVNMTPFYPEVITFKPAKTRIPGVRTEYLIDNGTVKFHFFKDPTFPRHFAESLQAAFGHLDPANVVIDYVPEAESWYAAISRIAIKLNDFLTETLIAKIKTAVENG